MISTEDSEPAEGGGRKRRGLGRKVFLCAAWLLGLLLLTAAGAGVWLGWKLRASLPRLAGELTVKGLSAAVTVDRDAFGIPSIRGANRLDVARATGFVHAQDRFFQMDLLRRRAAGELSELFGRPVVPADLGIRRHRFRAVARMAFGRAPAERRALIEAYTEGVNAALAAGEAEPFEYLALGTDPDPWRPEDTVLVVLNLFMELQDFGRRYESAESLVFDSLPLPLAEFLTPGGTSWDTPLVGGELATGPIPGPEVFDLRAGASAARPAREPDEAEGDTSVPGGSNNWAVAGAYTADGGALLANDMHLPLSVPNIWYRVDLSWPTGEGSARVIGVTVPGAPLVVVGSNTHVAWGFTNAQIDTSDLIELETDPDHEDAYLTPEGPEPFERYEEIVRVRGGEARRKTCLWTRWGPVIDEDPRRRRRALAWVAHRPDAVDLELAGLELAGDVDEAVAVARRSGIPAQNFVVADAAGRIAWTLAGRVPRRVGFEGSRSTSWSDGSRYWDGWLSEGEIPSLTDPESGRLWTANNRTVGGEQLARLGDGGYSLGVRARLIRDRLLALDRATAGDLLEIQLEDRAVYLDRWRDLLLETLTREAVAADPRRAEVRDFLIEWDAHAAVDSVDYRIVRSFRRALAARVFEPLTLSCRREDRRFNYVSSFTQHEGPLWRLVNERPLHLLDPEYSSWDELFLATLDDTLDRLLSRGGPLAGRVWGEVNTVRVGHPLSGALPFLRRWLDMPSGPLPGDLFTPRVQGPRFGASERMVVSPGREEDGIFHMPGGQSGHPLSPHYDDQYDAWARGEPLPFLPGAPVHTLNLEPEGN